MAHIGLEYRHGGRVPRLGAVDGHLGGHGHRIALGLFIEQAVRTDGHGLAGLPDQRRGGTIGFDTALYPAGTGFPAVHQHPVPRLDAVAPAASEHLAVQDEAAADPRSQGIEGRGLAALQGALVELRQHGGVRVVAQGYRYAGKMGLDPLL